LSLILMKLRLRPYKYWSSFNRNVIICALFVILAF
jgi:hypothetical protein